MTSVSTPSPLVPSRLIVVMGVAGCGKTTVGGALADRLGKTYFDADDFHPAENVAKMSKGVPLDDDDRWPWLDRLGRALHDEAEREGMVVAGCSALRRVYRERLTASAGEPVLFVFLKGSRELIAGRMAARSGHYMPLGLLDSQFATLEPPEAGENVLTVDIDDPAETLAEAILQRLDWPGAVEGPASRRMTGDGRMGLVGLGVMGRNLALNMADKGFEVAAYDPWAEARAGFAAAAGAVERIQLADTPGDLAASLAPPRSILIMVKAGAPVDAAIDSLLPHLAPGDSLIDGGNSHYRDTIRREAALKDRGIHFIGLGVSGGEEGARHGPSLMAGGDAEAYGRARPVLEAIAARFDGRPCCALVGGDGAGHFVKMIHNGIEYAVMQLIAEAYAMLRDAGGLSHGEMAAVFRGWNETELASYLVEITAAILDRKDELTGEPLVEMILDKAGQKGTGRWSSEAALELGVPTPTVTEAVFARALAALKDERVAAAGVIAGPAPQPAVADREALVEDLRNALLGGTIAAYAQGLAAIGAASAERGWNIDLAGVAAIWRAGCVIRAGLLDGVMRAFRDEGAPGNLLCAPAFAEMLATAQGGWRRALCTAIERGIPVPGLSSALAYFDGYRSPRLPANMIQAQRDCFGAHTYERTDREGSFHTQW